MKYEKHISKLRHLMVKIQGTDLQQVLLRAAAKRSEEIADKLYTSDEIFAEVKPKILKNTNKLSWNESFELVSDAESLAILKQELIEDNVESFQWEETLSSLLEGLTPTQQTILAPLLRNQHSYIQSERAMMPNRTLASQHSLMPESVYLGITRRIFAGNFEASQGLKAFHGLNIELEMIQAFASEIQTKISYEIISDLKALANKQNIDTVKCKSNATMEQNAKSIGIHINMAANNIACTTRRGAGNWIVVSPTMLSVLQESNSYKQSDAEEFGLFGELMEVGTLNKIIKVFSAPHFADDEILVGYKGGNGEIDTGYIYCPYVALMTDGLAMHPMTYEQSMRFMTRYGKFITEKAEAYYRNIKVGSDLLITKKE